MRCGLMTGTFYRSELLLHLDRIGEIGFEKLEIWCYEPHFFYQSPGYVEKVGRELALRDIRVSSLHATFHGLLDLSGPDDCDRVHALETVKNQFRVASELGAGVVVIHPGSKNVPEVARPERIGYFIDAVTMLLDLCRELGIRIAVENMGPGYLGDRLEEIELILEQFSPEEVGLCLDTSHASLTGDLFNYLDRLGERIVTTHLSDNLGIEDDHLPPGRGEIDWQEFFQGLERIGYRGPLVLEILDRRSPDLYRSVMEGKEYLDDLVNDEYRMSQILVDPALDGPKPELMPKLQWR